MNLINYFSWKVDIKVPADKIPENINIDITELEIGNYVYVKDLNLGDDVEVLDSGDKALVAINISSRAKALADSTED